MSERHTRRTGGLSQPRALELFSPGELQAALKARGWASLPVTSSNLRTWQFLTPGGVAKHKTRQLLVHGVDYFFDDEVYVHIEQEGILDELIQDLEAKEKEWKRREDIKRDAEKKRKKAKKAAKGRDAVKGEVVASQEEEEPASTAINFTNDHANRSSKSPNSASKRDTGSTGRIGKGSAIKSPRSLTESEKRSREIKSPRVKSEKRARASPAIATSARKRTKAKGKGIPNAECEDEEEEKMDIDQQYVVSKRELVNLEKTALEDKLQLIEQQVILKRYEINKLQAERDFQRDMKTYTQRYSVGGKN